MLSRGLVSPGQAVLLPGSGVDLEHFRLEETPKEAAPFVFAFAGRVIWEKGFPYLPEAMRLVKQRSNNIECHVYGFLEEGNPKYVGRERLAEWESEGLLSYRGPLEDVRKAYRASDCVVLPTYYREGVPKSLLEAAAMGKPIIATNVSGCGEAVKHGVNGLLCEARDAESLAEAMIRMAALDAGERRRMGKSGRELVEAGFGQERIIRAYLDAAREMTAPRPATPGTSARSTANDAMRAGRRDAPPIAHGPAAY
jgi:glycosyltransferase involved in cell wall biosynthesis